MMYPPWEFRRVSRVYNLQRHMFKTFVTPLRFKCYDQVLEGFSTFFESSLFMYDRTPEKKTVRKHL
jgi:hypothetical protein